MDVNLSTQRRGEFRETVAVVGLILVAFAGPIGVAKLVIGPVGWPVAGRVVGIVLAVADVYLFYRLDRMRGPGFGPFWLPMVGLGAISNALWGLLFTFELVVAALVPAFRL